MLTGKTRYRLQKRLFAKPLIVFQVEETRNQFCAHTYTEGPSYEFWRDATFEDLFEIQNATLSGTAAQGKG